MAVELLFTSTVMRFYQLSRQLGLDSATALSQSGDPDV